MRDGDDAWGFKMNTIYAVGFKPTMRDGDDAWGFKMNTIYAVGFKPTMRDGDRCHTHTKTRPEKVLSPL